MMVDRSSSPQHVGFPMSGQQPVASLFQGDGNDTLTLPGDILDDFFGVACSEHWCLVCLFTVYPVGSSILAQSSLSDFRNIRLFGNRVVRICSTKFYFDCRTCFERQPHKSQS